MTDMLKNSNLMAKLYSGIRLGALLIWFGLGIGIAYSKYIQKPDPPTNNAAIFSDMSQFRLEIRDAIMKAHDDNRVVIETHGNRLTVVETHWIEIDKRLDAWDKRWERIEDKINHLK